MTPELGAEGQRMLREGATVHAMCARLGVDKRSWYRWVHAQFRPVRKYVRRRRDPKAISASVERRMIRLDREGLARVDIAARLGLHVNTVVKYLLKAGRPRKSVRVGEER